jgi:hypothetical protein
MNNELERITKKSGPDLFRIRQKNWDWLNQSE